MLPQIRNQTISVTGKNYVCTITKHAPVQHNTMCKFNITTSCGSMQNPWVPRNYFGPEPRFWKFGANSVDLWHTSVHRTISRIRHCIKCHCINRIDPDFCWQGNENREKNWWSGSNATRTGLGVGLGHKPAFDVTTKGRLLKTKIILVYVNFFPSRLHENVKTVHKWHHLVAMATGDKMH